MVRTWLVLTVLVMVAFVGRTAGAAGPEAGASATGPGGATAPAASGSAAAVPAGVEATPGSPPPAPGGDTTATTAEVPMVDAAAQSAPTARYGLGARLRLTSVPKWMLGLFLDQSVPLTSYAAGLEFFRRSGSFDLVMGLGYQSLSPSAGNWLGKGNPPGTDTDYIQFDGLAAYSVDMAFILHTEFNEYVGMHYGGGIGIHIIAGRMLRTSAGSAGCATDPGNPVVCHPVIAGCTTGPCTESQLQGTEGGPDSPTSPSRFSESRVPSVFPIVNVITGLDVHLPNVPGFEMKFDVGFFLPYFFFGLSTAYQI